MTCRLLAFAPIALVIASALPRSVQAGGPEFPADGTRGLGRGGARAARADDPTIMTRNPAALALLWDDQAIIGSHLNLVDACFQPTGGFAWGLQSMGRSAYDLGEGPVYPFAGEGDTYLDGRPLEGFASEPYPEVCFEGPNPFLPYAALSTKLSDDLGVGFGFFPPDTSSLWQWGNADGTVDTPNGLRPNPLRYFRSHQNITFFSLLGAAGWRIAPWLSVGAGFQWTLLAYNATTWSTPVTSLDPETDVRGDLFGRDLFVPGIVASVHLQPFDFLDLVVGFKWSDRIQSKVKLDITTGAFGTGEQFQFNDASRGEVTTVGSSIPTTAHNLPGEVSSPPVYVPQLTVALRFSDLLRPRITDPEKAREANPGKVLDHMATELWDIEVDFIYYFNSVFDRAQFTTTSAAQLELTSINEQGIIGSIPASPGDCVERDPVTNNCIGDRVVQTVYNGKDQVTVRVGGEYNILPGVLALRVGYSYEDRGQSASDLNVLNYMLGRQGIHAGATLRVADKTDISIGYAHFIHEDIRLQVFDGDSVSTYPPLFRTPEYNFRPGLGVPDMMNQGAELGGFDETAGVEVPNADMNYPGAGGPYFLNAGSYFYHLDTLSVSVTQHF